MPILDVPELLKEVIGDGVQVGDLDWVASNSVDNTGATPAPLSTSVLL